MKPILFNTEMVRAIRAGRKTVTRRVVKPQPEERHVPGEIGCYIYRGIPCGLDGMTNFALYRPGNILYVRETWGAWSRTIGTPPALYYKADGDSPDGIAWRPSIHMPREAARIFLRVTDVRVERLQDITEEQAVKEGFEAIPCDHPCGYPCTDCMNTGYLEPALLGFVEVWNSTIKPADRTLYGWGANPWVWVIQFERISRPEEVNPHD